MSIRNLLAVATVLSYAFRGVSAAVLPRDAQSSSAGSTCPTDGALLCSPDGKQYALCSHGSFVYQAVAAGTTCKCDGSQCGIVAGQGAANGAGPGSSSSAAPSMAPSMAPYPTASSPAASSPVGWNATSPPTATPSAPAGPCKPKFAGAKKDSTYLQMFTGDGSVCDGWPSKEQWLSFDDMWDSYMPILKTGCSSAEFGVPNNTPTEINELKAALIKAAKDGGLPVNFIFAIMGQESNGCLRVKTTANSVQNPGIFQSHAGLGTCFGAGNAACPSGNITQMCKDGVEGTPAGDGLKQVFKQAGGTDDAQTYYKAARIYNSGSLSGADLGANGATNCYCTDIANRLVGWSKGPKKCSLDGA